MKRYLMTVVCTTRDFYSHWYTTGKVININTTDDPSKQRYVVDYGAAKSHAQNQADRFALGLISAAVEER